MSIDNQRSIISRFPRWVRFTLLALLIKGAMLAWFVSIGHDQFPERMESGIVFHESDYVYFLYPVDSYFENGHYSFNGEPFAGRMPGYWIIYMGLRFVFAKETALFILIFLQILLSAFAVYALARTAERILGSPRTFYLSFFFFLLLPHVTVFDFRTMTESFSVSAVILGAYYLFRFRESAKSADLFLCGASLTWAVFLRPFLGPALVLPPLLIFTWLRRGEIRTKLIFTFVIYSSFFVVAESIWVARNFTVMGKFIPLESPMHEAYGDLYPRGELSFYELSYAWGENGWGWDENLVAGWFHKYKHVEPVTFAFKDHYFQNATAFNRDSIIELHKLYVAFRDSLTPRAEKDRLDSLIADKCNLYLADYKQANPLRYHVLARIQALNRLVTKQSPGYLPFADPAKTTTIHKGYKLFSGGAYFFLLLGGLAGLFIGLFDFHLRSGVLFCLLYVGMNATVIVYGTTSQEPRYFITSIPFLLIGWAFVMDKCITFAMKGKP